MRYRVLLHTAVLLELVGSVRVIALRTITQDPGGGLLNFRNLPLGAVVFISVLLLEIFRRRLTGILLPLVLLSSIVFFFSALYLPPNGHSYELAITLAYVGLVIMFSTALVVAFSPDAGFFKVSEMSFGIAALAMAAGFLNTFSHNHEFHGRHEADVAVVLGSGVLGPHTPSPDLRGRLDAAAQLYKKGEVRKIAVTGGTRRFHTYESEIGAWYLHSIGIPDSDIITEDKTQNTIQQIVYVKRFLIGKLKMKRVVIVSDDWHLPRALLMCNWLNVEAKGYGSHYKMSLHAELFWRLRESAGLQAYVLFGG